MQIDDTFAEAFDMRATALVITADTERWARQAATSATGFATSIIACGVEAGIDRMLAPDETPDGRPGARVLMFAGSSGELQKQLVNRVGQCVLTCAGAACYAGLDGERGPGESGDGADQAVEARERSGWAPSPKADPTAEAEAESEAHPS